MVSIGRFGFSAANAGNGACSAYPSQALDMTARNLLIMHDDLASVTSAAPLSSPAIYRSTSGPACLVSQTPQAAIILDGLVSHVTVTDPRHALSGQRLSLASLRSARGPAYIVVTLPDGRRRSLRRSITDLAGAEGAAPRAPAIPLQNGLRISVRTLLPLARHIVARLATAVEEVTRADRSPPVAASAPPCSLCVTAVAALAEPAARDANTDRPPCRRPAAADGAGKQRGAGGLPC